MNSLPNLITLFRILIIPIIITCAFYASTKTDIFYHTLVVLFILGIVSDAVDGIIARAFNQVTPAGIIMDPVADKLLIHTMFLIVFFHSKLLGFKLPIWAIILFLSRDVILLMGLILLFILQDRRFTITPSLLGKFTTAFQFLFLLSILVGFPKILVVDLFVTALLFTCISGLQYICHGMNLLMQEGGLKR